MPIGNEIAIAASTTHEIGVSIAVTLTVAIIFELIREPVMRAIRATPNLNASKPFVLLPVMVVGFFIAIFVLHLLGVRELL